MIIQNTSLTIALTLAIQGGAHFINKNTSKNLEWMLERGEILKTF